jgi:hypothetical protein
METAREASANRGNARGEHISPIPITRIFVDAVEPLSKEKILFRHGPEIPGNSRKRQDPLPE